MEAVTNLLSQIFGAETLAPTTLLVLGGLIMALAMALVMAACAIVFTWMERKVAGFIQSRYGPMRVGHWHGVAQPIADMLKILQKEDIIPAAADMDMGLFYIFAVSSLAVIGILMAGWSSNNKWALYGAARGAAQIVSYEIPLALAAIPVVMATGSLNMVDIVLAQQGGFGSWYLFYNPFVFIAFVVYFICSVAEVNRTPFDLPETESELVAGYHTEYTGMRFAFFFLAEYANLFLVSCIATALFLGGWWSPVPGYEFAPALAFVIKSALLVFLQMWLRWTLPRLRVDQLMFVCWKVMIPISLIAVVGAGIWMMVSGQVG